MATVLYCITVCRGRNRGIGGGCLASLISKCDVPISPINSRARSAILCSPLLFPSPLSSSAEPHSTPVNIFPAESGAYSRDSPRFPRRRPFIYLNRHTPSGQSRVYRVAQLRTHGVHCRESTGTGPVNLKVVLNSNGWCLGRSP